MSLVSILLLYKHTHVTHLRPVTGWSLGVSSVIFVVTAEIIPIQIKTQANAVSYACNAVFAYSVVQLFHTMKDSPMGLAGDFEIFFIKCHVCNRTSWIKLSSTVVDFVVSIHPCLNYLKFHSSKSVNKHAGTCLRFSTVPSTVEA